MKKMKCIVIENGNNENQLRLVKINIPEVTSQEVLIRILYSGVNRPDILQRQGKYKPPRDASPVLGLEAAGEIVKVGYSVTKFMAFPSIREFPVTSLMVSLILSV